MRPATGCQSVSALSDAARTTPSGPTARSRPCGWIDPGMRIGSRSQAVRSSSGSGMGRLRFVDQAFERGKGLAGAGDHLVTRPRIASRSLEFGAQALPRGRGA